MVGLFHQQQILLFLLGILSLLGKRVPLSLKVFLTALAIIDDLGAILIIAIFYSGDLSIKYLSLMFVAFILLLILNKFNIKKFLPYLIVGLFSGILLIILVFMQQ